MEKSKEQNNIIIFVLITVFLLNYLNYGSYSDNRIEMFISELLYKSISVVFIAVGAYIYIYHDKFNDLKKYYKYFLFSILPQYLFISLLYLIYQKKFNEGIDLRSWIIIFGTGNINITLIFISKILFLYLVAPVIYFCYKKNWLILLVSTILIAIFIKISLFMLLTFVILGILFADKQKNFFKMRISIFALLVIIIFEVNDNILLSRIVSKNSFLIETFLLYYILCYVILNIKIEINILKKMQNIAVEIIAISLLINMILRDYLKISSKNMPILSLTNFIVTLISIVVSIFISYFYTITLKKIFYREDDIEGKNYADI